MHLTASADVVVAAAAAVAPWYGEKIVAAAERGLNERASDFAGVNHLAAYDVDVGGVLEFQALDIIGRGMGETALTILTNG